MKYTSLLLLLLSVTLSAQPTLEWSRTFGGSNYDLAYTICEMPAGGFVLAGVTSSTDGDVFGNHGGADFWIIKLSASGALQWKKLYGGSVNDSPYALSPTNDGGVIVAGYSSSNDGDVSGNHGETDGWVIKLNQNGALEWQKSIGGSQRDYFESVMQTPDNGFVLAGHTKSSDGDLSFNHGDIDFWVVKLTELGTLQWSKSFGGSGQELARSITVTADGGYMVVGETLSTDGDITEQQGSSDFWIVKLSESGALEWQKTYGGHHGDRANGVKQTFDGGYIIIGSTGSVNSGDVYGNADKGSNDFWVVKIDNSGELEWQVPLGGTEPEWGESVIQLPDSSYVVAGAAQSSDGDISDTYIGQDMWALSLRPNGEIMWQKAIGGSGTDDCYSVISTSDGGLALAGFAWSTDGDLSGQLNRGKSDIWAVKLAPETVSATADPLANGLSFYPNPAKDWVSINASGVATLRDMSGRLLHTSVLPPGGLLDIRALPAGTYQVEVQAAGGRERYFGKLVVGR